MRGLLTFVVLWFVFSCNTSHKQEPPVTTPVVVEAVKLDLGNKVIFNWDRSRNVIVKDELFERIAKDYPEKRNYIIDKIRDTTDTEFRFCESDTYYEIGEIALLLNMRIERLSFLQTFDIQMDSYIWGCPHPNGFKGFVEKNRDYIIKRLKKDNGLD